MWSRITAFQAIRSLAIVDQCVLRCPETIKNPIPAQSLNGSLKLQYDCDHPVTITFAKCGNPFLFSKTSKSSDTLFFQEKWVPFLVNKSSEHCEDNAGSIGSFDIHLRANAKFACKFIFSVSELFEDYQKVEPITYFEIDQPARNADFKVYVEPFNNQTTLTIEHSFPPTVSFHFGKCGMYDNRTFSSEHNQWEVIERFMSLVCNSDQTKGFTTHISHESPVIGFLSFGAPPQTNTRWLRNFVFICVILFAIMFCSACFNFCLNSDGLSDDAVEPLPSIHQEAECPKHLSWKKYKQQREETFSLSLKFRKISYLCAYSLITTFNLVAVLTCCLKMNRSRRNDWSRGNELEHYEDYRPNYPSENFREREERRSDFQYGHRAYSPEHYQGPSTSEFSDFSEFKHNDYPERSDNDHWEKRRSDFEYAHRAYSPEHYQGPSTSEFSDSSEFKRNDYPEKYDNDHWEKRRSDFEYGQRAYSREHYQGPSTSEFSDSSEFKRNDYPERWDNDGWVNQLERRFNYSNPRRRYPENRQQKTTSHREFDNQKPSTETPAKKASRQFTWQQIVEQSQQRSKNQNENNNNNNSHCNRYDELESFFRHRHEESLLIYGNIEQSHMQPIKRKIREKGNTRDDELAKLFDSAYYPMPSETLQDLETCLKARGDGSSLPLKTTTVNVVAPAIIPSRRVAMNLVSIYDDSQCIPCSGNITNMPPHLKMFPPPISPVYGYQDYSNPPPYKPRVQTQQNGRNFQNQNQNQHRPPPQEESSKDKFSLCYTLSDDPDSPARQLFEQLRHHPLIPPNMTPRHLIFVYEKPEGQAIPRRNLVCQEVQTSNAAVGDYSVVRYNVETQTEWREVNEERSALMSPSDNRQRLHKPIITKEPSISNLSEPDVPEFNLAVLKVAKWLQMSNLGHNAVAVQQRKKFGYTFPMEKTMGTRIVHRPPSPNKELIKYSKTFSSSSSTSKNSSPKIKEKGKKACESDGMTIERHAVNVDADLVASLISGSSDMATSAIECSLMGKGSDINTSRGEEGEGDEQSKGKEPETEQQHEPPFEPKQNSKEKEGLSD
uniref:Uncharacterized protein n=1 Tax=Caenorhabditis japonica TaxID=281687 RepID=A0A8R1DZT1_CAEJA